MHVFPCLSYPEELTILQNSPEWLEPKGDKHMFVQAEKLSYMEPSQNKSIKAVSAAHYREKLLITGITIDIYSFETFVQ